MKKVILALLLCLALPCSALAAPSAHNQRPWHFVVFTRKDRLEEIPAFHPYSSMMRTAAAAVLAHAFGSDRVSFTMASPSALPEAPLRRFASFSAAAKENADSRVRAGLHFRFATDAGLQLGERIGQQAVRTLLTPLR